MKARTRSAVLSDGERPRSIRRIRPGSPTAFTPRVVGFMPVRLRNALTRELNCCSRAFMAGRWGVARKRVNHWGTC